MNPSQISLTVGDVVSILGLMITFAGIFGTIMWNLYRRLLDNTKELAAVKQHLSDDMAAFKLDVAEKYVSSNYLTEIEARMERSEARMVASMTNLTARIDRLIERMEKPS